MRLVGLANAFGRKYRHTILAMDGNTGAAVGLDSNLDCTFEAMTVVKSSGISLANLRNARRLLRKLRPDLLITYNWGAIEWALANGPLSLCPQVHIEDGFGPDESPQHQNPRRAMMRRFLLYRCSQIIVPSHTLYRLAIDKWRLRRQRVVYLPNGIDCDRFSTAPDPALLRSMGIDNDALVIGTVAVLRPEKNLKRLLRVFAALPRALGAKLVIVGDGPEREMLGEAARQLGVAAEVLMPGAITHPERLLGRFDVFALTSDTEQMPYSVLEAMAAGLPVVATDVGDVKHMLAPENAPFVLPRHDEAGFVHGLQTLLTDSKQRVQIGRCNRDHAHSNYTFDAMMARYDAIFSQREQCRAN